MAERTPKCPICGAPTALDFRPFCSRRCADVDLSRWLKGAYAIPITGADDDEDGDNARELMHPEARTEHDPRDPRDTE